MFFVVLAVFLVISYVLLSYCLQLFFLGKIERSKFSLIHIFVFLSVYGIFIGGSFLILDEELANRVQHALGGGFTMVMIFYFSVLASKVQVTKFQFICLAVLIATGFGVANELAESYLQMQNLMIFAPNLYDTWLDLWANTFGIVLGVGIFTFFLKNENGNSKKEG